MKVAIVSYGTGNIASLYSALKLIGADSFLAESISDFKKADSLIFPGIGHFANAARNLEKSGLKNYLKSIIADGIPTLGICLGFQLLTQSSEEAQDCKGFGFLPLSTVRIKVSNSILNKVPHLGWNNICKYNENSKLLKGIDFDQQLFYYSNAYGVLKTETFEHIQASYLHEKEMLALVEYKNVYGVQFHPEKSRKQGLRLLQNFLKQK